MRARAWSDRGDSTGANVIFGGFGLGLLYKILMVALKGWKDVPEKIFAAPFKAGSISVEVSPELLGVGYIYRSSHRLTHVCGRSAFLSFDHPAD